MTILTEVSAPFKASLVQFAGHHWTAKSIITVILFTLFSLILSRSSEDSKGILNSAIVLVISVAIAGLVIFSYFTWAFLTE
ncbi:MAG: hypothetical protein WAV98_02070 [Minisyncoccia bacterium]